MTYDDADSRAAAASTQREAEIADDAADRARKVEQILIM